jgi:hypothetical protein
MADSLSGFNTVTINNADPANVFLEDLTYEGNTYAGNVLLFGTTTRYYNTTNGTTLLWPEGDGVPADISIVPSTSNPKTGDVGSHADNLLWNSGSPDISSLDGIAFQRTVFSSLVSAIFVFERGGNDSGTVQPILADDSLGAPLTLTAGSNAGNPYLLVGNFSGQNDNGYVYLADVPIKGIQINAPGHDALTITAVPEPATLSLLGLGLGGLLLARRRHR